MQDARDPADAPVNASASEEERVDGEGEVGAVDGQRRGRERAGGKDPNAIEIETPERVYTLVAADDDEQVRWEGMSKGDWVSS